jgi:hypothetical protein
MQAISQAILRISFNIAEVIAQVCRGSGRLPCRGAKYAPSGPY